MKLLDRDSFLLTSGEDDKPSTMLCVRLVPLAQLAEEMSSRDIEKLKAQVEYRGGLCFSGSVAYWAGSNLFIRCAESPEHRERITEECQSYADLMQERYTLFSGHGLEGRNADETPWQHYYLRAVIGAAPLADGSISKALKDAERAADKAALDTGNVVVWYEGEDEPRSGNLAITRGVVEMLNQGSFRLVYQPQIDLRSGSIHGLEVLLRAPDDPGHPLYGMTPPALIQGVRSLNLLTDLTIQILLRATRAYYVWQSFYSGAPLKISVNVTPDILLNGYQAILDALPTGLPLDWLVLEITESDDIAPQATPSLAKVVTLLRSHGIEISIDDFGSGFSNFDRLREIPCDEIKLDRSLVTRMVHQEVDASIVDTIVAVAREHGLRVVGEGIETQTQWQMLEKAGCQVGQGFFFSEGKPEAVISKYLSRPHKYDRDWKEVETVPVQAVVR